MTVVPLDVDNRQPWMMPAFEKVQEPPGLFLAVEQGKKRPSSRSPISS
jgi:hypothetical protein